MSNPLSVRRVRIQTIDEAGVPQGEPSWGIVASDDQASSFIDTFESLDDLNRSINDAGCIMDMVPDADSLFDGYDREKIGTANFYGKDWR